MPKTVNPFKLKNRTISILLYFINLLANRAPEKVIDKVLWIKTKIAKNYYFSHEFYW